jgi:VWFA-related protein
MRWRLTTFALMAAVLWRPGLHAATCSACPELVEGQARHAGGPEGPPSIGQQTTFRAATHLIVQTVSVKDKQGRPVLGLTAKDFIVTEDGQPQDVAFVEYEALDATPLSPVTALTTDVPPGAATSFTTVAPVTRETVAIPASNDPKYRGRRLLILYFDLSGMSFFEKGRTFSSAAEYIARRMTAADMVAVMVFQGRGVELRLDFTDHRAALGGVIQQLEIEADDARQGIFGSFDPGGAFGEDDATFNLFSTDRQLSALQTAVTDFGPLPQTKTLIYFGSGLRVTGYENMAQLRATVNAAVRANVTLNPIDSRGLQAVPPMGDATRPSPGGIGMFSGTIAQSAVTRGDRERDVLYAIAKDTGGRATFDTNDLAGGVADTAAGVTGYYILGYYTKNTATDGKYRRVKITLANNMAADLSYRQGYYGNKDYSKFNAFDKERQLVEALRLEDPITEIPMAMELNYFQISSVEYFVPISIRMPGSELARQRPNGSSRALIDMIGEIKDEYGVTMRNSRDKVEFTLDPADAGRVARRPIQFETGFSLLPGNYVIKILARDATTGRIGTFQRSFSIPNLERERVKLPISTVLLTQQRVASTDALFTVKQKIPVEVANPLFHEGQKLVPSVTRTFNASRPLYVFLQAYERDSVAMRPLVVLVTFSRDGAKVFETEPFGVTQGWDPKSKAVPIRLTIPLNSLEPGAYDCQVTVLDPTSERAAFWRAPVVVVR